LILSKQSALDETDPGRRALNQKNFFAELKRRNVYKVAVAYAVIGWLLVQAASILFPTFEAPDWSMKVFVVIVAAGFVIALLIAWTFEMTPEGMKRTENISPNEHLPQWSRRKFGTLVIGVATLAAGLLIFQFWRSWASEKSIAVLPFENLSHDPENAYFAEGVQDEILTRLAKVADLKVISRTSTQRFKSTPEDLPHIAKQLGVAHILEGSVQKQGEQVRVTVQLIRAATDAHLWAETFDRKLTDIFAVESEIAKNIADKLRAKLTGSEALALAARRTENPEAYQSYLKGRFFWNKRTAKDFNTAIGYFQQAIDKDPGFALAYAGLADTYVLLSGFAAASPAESLPKAKEAALKALQLDNTLGEAHTSLAQAVFAYDFDFAKADQEFRRGIELNPNYATAHQWYAESGLAAVGRFDEAIAEMRRALELDPLSVIINADVGTILCSAGRYDDAIEQLRKTLEMDPDFYYAHWNLGQALELKGHTAQAMAEYEKASTLDDDPLPLALLGRLYGKVGRKDDALKILARLHDAAKERYVSPYDFAMIHMGLGEKDEAIRLLEQAYNEHSGYDIAFIRSDPLLNPLRGEPRFEALVAKVFAPKHGKSSP
jgi:TolB-like protein/Tfp pilus assembly protein PilF